MVGSRQQRTDGIRIGTGAICAAHRQRRAVSEVEIDGDAVYRRGIDDRVAAAAAVIDVVTVAGTADDGVVAGAGLDDVVAAAGLDRVVTVSCDDDVVRIAGVDVIVAVAGDDLIVAVAGDNLIVAVAGDDLIIAAASGDVIVAVAGGDLIVAAADGYVDRVVARDGKVVSVVRAAEVDGDRTAGRRGEHEGVPGPGGVLGRLVRGGEAAVAGRIDQQIAAAAVLNDLDVR